VTASNDGGIATATLAITVNPKPPSELSYSTPTAVYTVGTAITDNTPRMAVVLSPALRLTGPAAGLSLNATTGVISGTPTAVAAQAVYTVTASNAGGTTTAQLTVTVQAALEAPKNLTYSAPLGIYKVGTAITNNSPSHQGGDVASYLVSPALPPGLTLDATSGVISGSPTTTATLADYTSLRPTLADPLRPRSRSWYSHQRGALGPCLYLA